MNEVTDWTVRLTVHQEIEIEQRVEQLISQGYVPKDSKEATIQVLAYNLLKEIEAGR